MQAGLTRAVWNLVFNSGHGCLRLLRADLNGWCEWGLSVCAEAIVSSVCSKAESWAQALSVIIAFTIIASSRVRANLEVTVAPDLADVVSSRCQVVFSLVTQLALKITIATGLDAMVSVY